MQAPDSIEAALSRLMPAALSVEGQRTIEEMLDELAAPAVSEDRPAIKAKPSWGWLVPTAIAAAAVIIAHLVTDAGRVGPVADLPATDFSGTDIVLVGESDHIEEMTAEGWTSDPDGTAMKAVRIRVIEESSLRDGRTGIVVRVTQPRDEVVLMPVTAF